MSIPIPVIRSSAPSALPRREFEDELLLTVLRSGGSGSGNECAAYGVAYASLPRDEVDAARDLDAEGVARFEEDVEVRKGEGVECRRCAG